MTLTLPMATDNADFADDTAIDLAEQPTQPLLADQRRITEHDCDFVRLHTRTARALKASVRTLVRELRAEPGHTAAAQSRFIHRHMDLLRRVYISAHREGQRDFYAPISNTPRKWVSDPPTALVSKRLTWYGLVSVLKMAQEAAAAVQAERHMTLSETHAYTYTYTFAAPGSSSPVDQYLAGVDVRADLQANITWSGMQDGYRDGGAADSGPINLYSLIYWVLEPAAKHCNDCPAIAADNPYSAPGMGKELPATPGDGYTECGGGCKCSLSYTPPSVLQSIALDRVLRALGLPSTEDVPGGMVLPAGPRTVPADGFTVNQRRALDLYRATANGWNAAIEGMDRMPPFPPFIGDWSTWAEWANLDWETLPPQLQRYIHQMLEARLLWASPDSGGGEGE